MLGMLVELFLAVSVMTTPVSHDQVERMGMIAKQVYVQSAACYGYFKDTEDSDGMAVMQFVADDAKIVIDALPENQRKDFTKESWYNASSKTIKLINDPEERRMAKFLERSCPTYRDEIKEQADKAGVKVPSNPYPEPNY